jgi:hypothetical protein
MTRLKRVEFTNEVGLFQARDSMSARIGNIAMRQAGNKIT